MARIYNWRKVKGGEGINLKKITKYHFFVLIFIYTYSCNI